MKVIRQGKDPATQPIRATCGRCKTEVEFMPHGGRYSSDQRDGDYYSISCPTCHNAITKNVHGCGQQWER